MLLDKSIKLKIINFNQVLKNALINYQNLIKMNENIYYLQ